MQYLEKLRVYLQNMIMDNDMVDDFMSHVKQKTIKAGERILEVGERTPYVYFIFKGFIKSVYVYENGKERTLKFYPENKWCCLYNCIRQEASSVYVETIEETTVAYIDASYIIRIVVNNVIWRNVFLNIHSEILVKMRTSIDDFDSFTLEKRYSIFLERYSDILDRIDKKYIASYIGATKEELELLLSNKNNI